MVLPSLYLAIALTLTWWAPARRHTVVIEQFQFKPAVIRVAPGDTIVWENRDIVPHTATAGNQTWDTGNIAAKARATTVVRKRGEQEFVCLYHSNMKGKLVVR